MAPDNTSNDKENINAANLDPAAAANPVPGRVDPVNRIRIDDKEYDFAELSEEARGLIVQMRMADQELSRHRAMVAMLHEARQLYGTRLKAVLPTT
ncbi:DUF6447 family protein [Desulfosarcina sp. OttesenSCG-928-A07]|nr:DUF6447 family protein [Desulfosarcina sp. OttesenSCG-928-G17]MDL2329312.1 DUF6447 family protein [Desulfosarcina sp. OttesenSCG-928-A07]